MRKRPNKGYSLASGQRKFLVLFLPHRRIAFQPGPDQPPAYIRPHG